jgi:hypothetical protein
MASKISQLFEADSLTGQELFPIVSGGGNYKVRISHIVELVTKASIGLDRVDNTTDLEKPISNATTQALLGKANTTHQHAITDVTNLASTLNNKSDVGHHHVVADITDAASLISVDLKTTQW